MGWLSESLNSSIGKKVVMAVTGICLILFLIVHLAGNLTLFVGEEAFNGYVHTLEPFKPIIRVVEVVLALIFFFHILKRFQFFFWFLQQFLLRIDVLLKLINLFRVTSF